MNVYKVYEKTIYGDTNISYWSTEVRANEERQRLIDAELKLLETTVENLAESLDPYFRVDKILVRE